MTSYDCFNEYLGFKGGLPLQKLLIHIKQFLIKKFEILVLKQHVGMGLA